MTKRILIADDHQLFGEGLKELLSKQSSFEVAGPLKEKEEIIQGVIRFKPHVLLLDINLGKTNGIDLGRNLKNSYPGIKIIMLTMYEDEKFLKQSKQFQMDGYLLKDCETSVLLSGIQKVLNGETCFTEFEPASEEQNIGKDNFMARYQLSVRELEVMHQLKHGFNNQEIAEQLNLSFHTVKTHRKNIYMKLNVSNVAELIEVMNKL